MSCMVDFCVLDAVGMEVPEESKYCDQREFTGIKKTSELSGIMYTKFYEVIYHTIIILL